MFAGTGDGDTVQEGEEIELQQLQQVFRRPLLALILAPFIEGRLGTAEDDIHRFSCIELVVDEGGIALIGQLELVPEVGEPVVHRCGGEHQDTGFHSFADDVVQQLEVAVLSSVIAGTRVITAISEVMALVDDDEIIIAPIELREVRAS